MRRTTLIPALLLIAVPPAHTIASDYEDSARIPAGETRHPAVYHYDKMRDALDHGNLQTAGQHARLRTQHLGLFNRFNPSGGSEGNLRVLTMRRIELTEKIAQVKAARAAQQEELLQIRLSDAKPDPTIQLEANPLESGRLQEILEESQQRFENLPEIETP